MSYQQWRFPFVLFSLNIDRLLHHFFFFWTGFHRSTQTSNERWTILTTWKWIMTVNDYYKSMNDTLNSTHFINTKRAYCSNKMLLTNPLVARTVRSFIAIYDSYELSFCSIYSTLLWNWLVFLSWMLLLINGVM